MSAATQLSFGFELYNLDYFKKHKSTLKDFEYWQKGFPFEIESIKEKKELRRNRILKTVENRLERIHNVLMVGESGTSKSTILKEIMCDYLDNDYLVLYNRGTNIDNIDILIKFVESLLNEGKKILIATDDAHNVFTAPIFYMMDQLSRFEPNEHLRFILSARLPDFDRFICDGLSKVQETYRGSIRKFVD